MQTVLAATDLSPAGDRAFERGILLSAQTGARLHVMHVVPGYLPRSLGERRAARARARILSHLASQAPDRLDDVVVDIRRGERARWIVRHAEDIGADLVIVGMEPARGMWRLSRPVRRRVLCDGLGALLVVRDDVRDYYRRTVFATDNGTDLSAAAAAVRQIVPNTSVRCVQTGPVAFQGRDKVADQVLGAKQSAAADLVAVSVERHDSLFRVPFRSLALALVGRAACDTLVVPAA